MGGTGQSSPLSALSCSLLSCSPGGAMCRMPGQMSPGQSTFERTPSGPPSRASILPSMITAALVTEYSPVACSPQIPASEAMWIMQPRFRARCG
jgi:hypothetical protein